MKPKKNTMWSRPASTWCYVAAALLIPAGLALMCGEGSDYARFCPEIFSPRRVCLAPAMCLAGYLLVACGIVVSPRGGRRGPA